MGFLACVNKLVSLQTPSFSEGLVANIACVGLLPTVHQLVILQTRSLSERLVAQVTCMRGASHLCALSCVSSVAELQ